MHFKYAILSLVVSSAGYVSAAAVHHRHRDIGNIALASEVCVYTRSSVFLIILYGTNKKREAATNPFAFFQCHVQTTKPTPTASNNQASGAFWYSPPQYLRTNYRHGRPTIQQTVLLQTTRPHRRTRRLHPRTTVDFHRMSWKRISAAPGHSIFHVHRFLTLKRKGFWWENNNRGGILYFVTEVSMRKEILQSRWDCLLSA
jgi:hypothetical protein